MKTLTMTALAAVLTVAAPAIAQQAPDMPAAAPSESDEGAPPKPLEGIAASFRAPAQDAAGAYLTPNRDLSPEETGWHVRVALNVAALGCRDADEQATVAAYNAVLATHRAPLAVAATGTERRYQVRFGAKWRNANDDGMTRLYNFFAQTPAHEEFCAAAKAVLTEAQTTAPGDFARLAAAALPRLEAPFLAFYARYDAYRVDLAAWQVRHTPRVVVAVAAPTVALTADSPPVALAAATQPVVVAAAATVATVATGSAPVLLASVSTLNK